VIPGSKAAGAWR